MARLLFRNGPYAGKAAHIPLGKPITIGRNRDLELALPDLKLSRRHCQIEGTPNGFVVRDLASTNGTYINGHKVEGENPLHHLDVLAVGNTRMEFQCPELVGQPVAGGPASPPPPRTAEGVTKDEWDALLKDLDQALPPTPAPALPAAAQRPRLYFCDACNGSIPVLEVDLGTARQVGGKLYCKGCLAAAAVSMSVSQQKGLEEALQDLGEVEEIPMSETQAAPVPGAPAGGDATAVTPPVAVPPVASSPGQDPGPDEDLEEITPG